MKHTLAAGAVLSLAVLPFVLAQNRATSASEVELGHESLATTQKCLADVRRPGAAVARFVSD
jgi:hypothetical protein